MTRSDNKSGLLLFEAHITALNDQVTKLSRRSSTVTSLSIQNLMTTPANGIQIKRHTMVYSSYTVYGVETTAIGQK